MKTHIIVILLMVGYSYPSLSQEKNISGLIKYSQITAFSDTSKRYLQLTTLYFNTRHSLYKVGILQKLNSRDSSLMGGPLPEHRRYSIYVDLLNKKMISRQSADSELVLVSDTLEQIDWKILPDKRKIGEMNCQLAQGLVRGRTYKAWFTLDIPIGVGPWKLQGLPGIILEAQSLDNKVLFRFEGIQLPDTSNTEIAALQPTAKMRVLREAEFLLQRRRNEENFRKMIESQPDFEKGSIKIKTTGIEVFPEN